MQLRASTPEIAGSDAGDIEIEANESAVCGNGACSQRARHECESVRPATDVRPRKLLNSRRFENFLRAPEGQCVNRKMSGVPDERSMNETDVEPDIVEDGVDVEWKSSDRFGCEMQSHARGNLPPVCLQKPVFEVAGDCAPAQHCRYRQRQQYENRGIQNNRLE
jgi:hypothetical protein